MIGTTNVFRWTEKSPTIYQQIQSLVRAGKVQEQYSLGDIITVSGIEWQVVAFDVAIPADASLTHSMTLCTKDCVDGNLMFDAPEPANPDSDRKTYGNNRYAYSAIRQWLNSDKPAGEWWVSQHQYDVAPNYATTKDGFLTRLDPDFLTVIGKTKIKVVIPSIDGGGYEELEDKFYLLSTTELGLGSDTGNAEGANFPYFDSTYDSKKKRYGGNYAYYYSRTHASTTSGNVRCVSDGGRIGSQWCKSTYGAVPVCNII